MSVGGLAVDVLLGVGVAAGLLSAAGVLAARDHYDQLHFTAPATVIAPIAISAAVLIEEPLSSAGIKSVLIAVVMLVTGPVMVHATARAAWIRERGRWVVHANEVERREFPSRSSKPSR